MKKTLGGDRLGSGKKMQVDLHNYGRSTHDKGYIIRTTMSAGTLVPFMKQVALPGDTYDIHLDTDIKTHPTVGPLFGSFKYQADIFLCPIRLYQGQLHNNKLGIGRNMSAVKLPIIYIEGREVDTTLQDVDSQQINPSCILNYLGIRGVGHVDGGSEQRSFNAVPLLAYWDIYKNYYANKQEEIGAVIHTPIIGVNANVVTITFGATNLPQYPAVNTAQAITTTTISIDYNISLEMATLEFLDSTGNWINGSQIGTIVSNPTGTDYVIQYNFAELGNRIFTTWRYITPDAGQQRPIGINLFQLQNIDTMRERILAHAVNVTPFDVTIQNLDPYDLLNDGLGGFHSIQNSQEGLGLKTYQSDLLNNWLSTDWIDGAGGISDVTAIDTSGGSFTIDTLNLSKKVYDMLNRIAVSGGSYDDWLDAVYVHDKYNRAESPMYMGGLIKELVFQEVVSNSEASPNQNAGTQPLGTLAGRGVMGRKHKGGHIIINVDEPSYIIGIQSLTPRLDYSQGNDWDINLQTLDDLHKPQLDEIGFQELIQEQMAWYTTYWDGVQWVQKSAGKQPAWINYMTNINKVCGNFAIPTNEMFMILNRRYTPAANGIEIDIDDLTTYIDPAKYNHIFAQTSLDSQNFWVQTAVDITYRGKISARLIPNL